jgi:hypothetical protein
MLSILPGLKTGIPYPAKSSDPDPQHFYVQPFVVKYSGNLDHGISFQALILFLVSFIHFFLLLKNYLKLNTKYQLKKQQILFSLEISVNIRIWDKFFPDPGSRIRDPRSPYFRELSNNFLGKKIQFFVNTGSIFFCICSKIK